MKRKIEYETNKWFILATDFVTLRYENVNNRILIYKNHIIKNSFSHLRKAMMASTMARMANRRWWKTIWKRRREEKKASASMILCCYAFSLIFLLSCIVLFEWRMKRTRKWNSPKMYNGEYKSSPKIQLNTRKKESKLQNEEATHNQHRYIIRIQQ